VFIITKKKQLIVYKRNKIIYLTKSLLSLLNKSNKCKSMIKFEKQRKVSDTGINLLKRYPLISRNLTIVFY